MLAVHAPLKPQKRHPWRGRTDVPGSRAEFERLCRELRAELGRFSQAGKAKRPARWDLDARRYLPVAEAAARRRGLGFDELEAELAAVLRVDRRTWLEVAVAGLTLACEQVDALADRLGVHAEDIARPAPTWAPMLADAECYLTQAPLS